MAAARRFPSRTRYDWEAALARVAAGIPAWEPGTGTGYHAVTYGWLVGGIVRGATGRHYSEVLRTEVAEPLGIAGAA